MNGTESRDFDHVIERMLVSNGLPPMMRIRDKDVARFVENLGPKVKPAIANLLKSKTRLADAVNHGILRIEADGQIYNYQVFRIEDSVPNQRSILVERIQAKETQGEM